MDIFYQVYSKTAIISAHIWLSDIIQVTYDREYFFLLNLCRVQSHIQTSPKMPTVKQKE